MDINYKFTLKASSRMLMNHMDKKEIMEAIDKKVFYNKMDEVGREKLGRHGGIKSELEFMKNKNLTDIGRETMGAAKVRDKSIYYALVRLGEDKFEIRVHNVVNTEKERKKIRVKRIF